MNAKQNCEENHVVIDRKKGQKAQLRVMRTLMDEQERENTLADSTRGFGCFSTRARRISYRLLSYRASGGCPSRPRKLGQLVKEDTELSRSWTPRFSEG